VENGASLRPAGFTSILQRGRYIYMVQHMGALPHEKYYKSHMKNCSTCTQKMEYTYT
jgi:hypothetical protein